MPEIVVEVPDLPDLTLRDRDLIYAGERQRTRIIDRTLAGRDWRNKPFKPYSPNGPVYWYPRQHSPIAARRSSVKYYARVVKGAQVTRSGLGIRFPNYAALKQALGRGKGLVDLFGPGPGPHMLNAIDVRIDGNSILIGIYSEPEAARAVAHNEGLGHMPERRFLDVSDAEADLIAADVRDSMLKGLKAR